MIRNEVYVSPIDFVKIFIRWYVTKSTYHLLISSRLLLGGLSTTDHLLFSSEFSFFIYSLLGGLSTTDHLLFSSEFSFFIIIRWSVENRSPIVFVRIFFLYLFIYYYYYSLFLFISPPFFVQRITQDQFSQSRSISAQS